MAIADPQIFYGLITVAGAIILAKWNNTRRIDELNKLVRESFEAHKHDVQALTQQQKADIEAIFSKLLTEFVKDAQTLQKQMEGVSGLIIRLEHKLTVKEQTFPPEKRPGSSERSAEIR